MHEYHAIRTREQRRHYSEIGSSRGGAFFATVVVVEAVEVDEVVGVVGVDEALEAVEAVEVAEAVGAAGDALELEAVLIFFKELVKPTRILEFGSDIDDSCCRLDADAVLLSNCLTS